MRAWFVLGLMLPLPVCAQVPNFDANFDDVDRWSQAQSHLPPYPKPADYLPFKVSATATFDFFVDAKSISVGTDGVVRYSLIAKSPEGVLNISFEGIRCADRQFRIYALGRSDDAWSRARNSRWHALPDDTRNAQRAMLYGDFFCPAFGIIGSAEEGVRALKSGRHPRANSSRF